MKFIFDTGHSGIDPTTGKYVTPGKRMVKDDVTFYEGVNNRLVAKEIVKACKELGLDAELLFDHWKDLSLGTRVNLANDLYFKNNKKVFLISIHSDAAGNGKEWHSAKGVTTFIFENAGRKSQEFATILHTAIMDKAAEVTKNRGIKRANFQLLRDTACPAVLLELGFHTNKEEVKLIQSKEWHQKVAKAIANACNQIDSLERS